MFFHENAFIVRLVLPICPHSSRLFSGPSQAAHASHRPRFTADRSFLLRVLPVLSFLRPIWVFLSLPSHFTLRLPPLPERPSFSRFFSSSSARFLHSLLRLIFFVQVFFFLDVIEGSPPEGRFLRLVGSSCTHLFAAGRFVPS